jgi:small-conductance mechanosensitive channel
MNIDVKRIFIPVLILLQYLVQYGLRKRIFKRFKIGNIEIPFPHRTVYLREEKNWQK